MSTSPAPSTQDRPVAVVLACVLAALHAAGLAAQTVAGIVAVLGDLQDRPELGRSSGVLVGAAFTWALALLVAVGEGLLVPWLWRGRPWARVAQVIWSGAAGLIGALAVVAALSGGRPPDVATTVLAALCLAVVVLLRLPATSRWYRPSD